MRILHMCIVAFLIFSCGDSKSSVDENPTTCAVQEVPEGVQFTCIDKNGVQSSGVVKHGEQGAQGIQGPKGEAGKNGENGTNGENGKNGEGLKVAKKVQCAGSLEGWLPKSGYVIDFRLTVFETGDQFLAASTKLVRGEELLNVRHSSGFFVGSATEKPAISDGQFNMQYDGQALQITANGGETNGSIPCKEVAE